MSTITIIRHAEAEGNYYRRAHGHYDSLLTNNGEAQIEALRDRMKDERFDAVYSSDLYRARRTASVLQTAGGGPVRLLPDLREIHLGVWEDVPWGELAEFDAKALSIFMHQPGRFQSRGRLGEAMATVQSRMIRTATVLVRAHPGADIAVVSHGLAIRALIAALGGLSLERLQEISHTDNTAVSRVEWDGYGVPRVLFHGDNTHLGSLSTLLRQHWWRKDSRLTDTNLWFQSVVLPRDLPLTLHFLRDAWRDVYGSLNGFRDDISDAHTERMASAHRSAVVFAMRKRTPVGLVQLDTQIRNPDNTGHISLIYLVPEARGQSLGGQLIGHAVSVYRALGRQTLHLRVAEFNTPARRLYDALGFRETGREDGQHGKLIIMRKSIEVN